MEEKMNRKKTKLVPKFVFLMILIIFSISVLSYGSNREGKRIRVATVKGENFTGELLKISGRTLVLFEKETGRTFQVSIDDLKKMSILKKKNLANGFIKGVAAVLPPIINTGYDSDFLEHSTAQKVFFIAAPVLGGGLGMLYNALLEPSGGKLTYPVASMSVSEKDLLLSELDRSTRESVKFRPPTKKSFLSRWSVYFKPAVYRTVYKEKYNNYTGEDIIISGDSSGDTVINKESYLYEGRGKDASPVGITYNILDRFSLGLEYSSVTYWRGGWSSPDIIRDGIQYDSHVGVYFFGYVKTGFVTANYEVPIKNGNLGSFRIESGIGISHTRIDSVNYSPEEIPLPETYSAVKPAFKIGITFDPFPNDTFSTQVYVDYIYAPTPAHSFSTQGEIEFNNHSSGSTLTIKRNALMNVSNKTFNTGGFFIGVSLRLN